MTKLYLTETGPMLGVFIAGVWLAVGALIGAVHVQTLRWNIQKLFIDHSPRLALTIQLLRFAFIAGALAAITGRFGALPLLIATAGILMARTAFLQFGARP